MQPVSTRQCAVAEGAEADLIIEGRIYVGFRVRTEAIVIQFSFCAQIIDDEQSKFWGKPWWGHCYGDVYKSALQKVRWAVARSRNCHALN